MSGLSGHMRTSGGGGMLGEPMPPCAKAMKSNLHIQCVSRTMLNWLFVAGSRTQSLLHMFNLQRSINCVAASDYTGCIMNL